MNRPRLNQVINVVLGVALVAILVTVANRKGWIGTQVTATREGIVVRAPTYSQRVDLAIQQAYRATLSEPAAKAVRERKGRILADAPGDITGWPEGAEVGTLLADAHVRSLLEADDEEAAAKALYSNGVRVVAVQWRLSPSVDRGRRVLSRLYHHDQLEWFSLFRITNDLFLYEVLERPRDFPPTMAGQLIETIRKRLTGEPSAPLPDTEAREGEYEMIAAVRGQGRELAISLSRKKNLEAVASEMVTELERGHRRYMEWYGFPPIKYHMRDLSIEVHRVVEEARVEPRDQADLDLLWEMGIDGVILRDFEKKQGAAFPGSVAFTRSFKDTDTLFRKAASFHNMDKERPWRDPNVALEMIRTLHYKEVPGRGMVPMVRGEPYIPMEAVTLPNVRVSILNAARWYLANLMPDGRVLYKFWPAENRESDEYNIVRHTLATWNLVMAWKLDPKPEYLEGARWAQDYTNRFLQYDGDMAYYTHQNNTKLGTAVVGLLGMIELAQATGDRSNDELMVQLGRFVKFMQEPTGKFKGYHVDKEHPYYNAVNDIVPGEAALSLIFLARYFQDKSWLEPLPAYWSYYEPWYRQRVVKKQDDATWPTLTYDNETRLELVQFGPWTVMAANAYHQETGDERVARLGLDVGRWMIETYQWSQDRSPFDDYVGGYYKLPNELPAMQAFCYAEGTAAAYQLALRFAPEEAPYFEKSTREAVRFAFQMQYSPLNTYAFSRPWQVMGGIRYSMNETKVRIDYVHHALSAMYQYLDGAVRDPNLPESVKAGYVPPANFLVIPGNVIPDKGVMPPPRQVPADLPASAVLGSSDADPEEGATRAPQQDDEAE